MGKVAPEAAAAPVPGTDSGGELPCGKRRGARRAVGWAFGPVGARAVLFFKISSAENNT